MEFEMVEIKVEKGVIPDDVEIVVVRDVCTVEPDGLVLGRIRDHGLVLGTIRDPGSASAGDGFVVDVVSIQKIRRPDWKPPKMKNGWVTWDESGWQWWPMVPRAKSSDGWLNPETGGVDDSYYLDQEMTELLGMPDCAGYEWFDCIWEVGE